MANRKARSADGVRKPNPFGEAPDDASTKPPVLFPTLPQEAALRAELAVTQRRVTDLESQLKAEQEGRRADLERLLRELMEAKATIARLEERASKAE